MARREINQRVSNLNLTETSPKVRCRDLFADFSDQPTVREVLRALERPGSVVELKSAGSAHGFLVAWLRKSFPARSVLLISDSLKSQESLHSDLSTWLAELSGSPGTGLQNPSTFKLCFFPAWEVLPQAPQLPHPDVISERLETLQWLSLSRRTGQSGDPLSSMGAPLVVASSEAVMQPTFPMADFRRRTRQLRTGDRVNPLDLIEWLEEQGYEPEVQVSSKGELSLRGGIIDVWPLSSPWPVRLEFFGDELESLRDFDPHTQMSRELRSELTIPAAGEFSLLKRALAEHRMDAGTPDAGPAPATGLTASLLSHFPTDTIVVFSEPDLIEDHVLRYRQQVEVGHPLHLEWDGICREIEARGLTCLRLTEGLPSNPEAAVDFGGPEEVEVSRPSSLSIPFSIESLEAFRPLTPSGADPRIVEAQRREFFHQVHRWIRQGRTVHIFCNTQGERQRFEELWAEYGLSHPEIDTARLEVPHLHQGVLTRGFIFEEGGLVVITDSEIFGRYRVQRARRLKSPHAQAVRSALEVDFTDFDEGDFVVHLQHGIGIYRGLKVLPPARGRGAGGRAGEGQECLVIEYAAPDAGGEPPRLYVPVTEAHLVSKYVGAGKARPSLNTLGGTRWAKARDHAERAVRDLAGELLRVQAMRGSQPGHAFSADNNWQREFEASFEFEETPDQLRAITAAKQDMESGRPMDRLLCGDVGFGKTEVAIRAAFKAVMGGKQVAILVPTTVLAQQHFNSFRERMAEYPVRVEVLSRFRSAGQQRKVLEAAASGAVDIIIGTHRVVQSDVQFKDLGLVIVDEEQRFGVKHKEQFKLLRASVDVLTLSATPIPRTLYLALTGARDLSTLETPPQDRLPVETIVGNYDERVIRDAILREMSRGGQTYFLHNRVSTIEAVALKLRALIPDARILIGHGQMESDDLEKVMTRFVNGEADVLVSTTIIESGLDIPNANTIIIDRADRFGLSELYQLRGRVGRYKRQAYCYLMLPRHARLLTEARKRMSAIKQYSALGSGFKIAMRDLEIRGAGNILGAEQSGHITAVGFDLYCQLLKQSVQALKGEKVTPRIDVRLSLDFLASHPGEEVSPEKVNPPASRAKVEIVVPRDDDVALPYEPTGRNSRTSRAAEVREVRRDAAYLPHDYVRDSAHRIDLYRKLAQITSKADLDKVAKELRDRFGPIPPAVELLLGTHELRLLAFARGVTSIEVVDGKLKVTRGGELITVDGQFPRLNKREPKALIAEIRRWISNLQDSPRARIPVKSS